jgi:hypothetical protein
MKKMAAALFFLQQLRQLGDASRDLSGLILASVL